MTYSRRKLMGSLGALGLAACAPAPAKINLGFGKGPLSYLFTLGVASGDPVSDGFVLWTRLAPQPLQEDGGLTAPMPVTWQVSETQNFAVLTQSGHYMATSDWAHSVHVEISGLKPGREYFYRFIANGQNSSTGRAITSPMFGSKVDHLRLGVASCQHYEQGFFNSYTDMVAQDPDIILHMGDYIYEASWGPQVRRQTTADAITLADYRVLHAQYKTDAALQKAHAHAPWLFIWDDHEVANDYAGLNDENYMPLDAFKARRRAAYKAYYEHMPVRLRSKPHGDEMRLHDYFYYGNLATMALTDGRQNRTDQACQTPERGGGQVVNCDELSDTSRSMFGAEQERWLMSSFLRSGAEWEILAQPTLFSKLNQTNRAGVPGSWSDGWDGYPATRDMILNAAQQRKPKNFVSLGGDMHSWWQADLKADYADPDSLTVGTEFVTTSVTAHSYSYNRFMSMMPDNPHINFFDDRKRGYSLIDITPDTFKVEMREMDSVYDPNSAAKTRKTFIVESGQAGAKEI